MLRLKTAAAALLVIAVAAPGCSRNRDVPVELAPSRMTTIGVNAYLWRAALDTLSFAPLISADPNGGVIVTDWYSRPTNPGERVKLTGRYPSEIVGLADNLNTLIDTERRRLARYRNTLDDLAHSLKTPLAAMHTLLAELKTRSPDRAHEALDRELERMDQRVSYQLRRARATGATGLGTEPVAVGRIVEDLKQTLDKVYRDKRVSCIVDVAPGAVFRGDPGDLTEILGNLMDNGYKYCKARVRVTARSDAERLVVTVGDDGRGITSEEAATLFQRGKRVDESVPGQGIGLAVVRETVELYRGTLDVGRSELGGAELRLELARAGLL